MNTVVLFILLLLAIVFSSFFSGTETGVYRLSRIRLRIGAERQRPLYRLLASAMEDSYGMIISILLGNNLANYLATTVATLFFLRLTDSEQQAQGLTTAVMTPLLFLFGEIVPKSLFYYRSNQYMTVLAPVIWCFHALFTRTGAVAAMKWISRGFERLLRIPMNTERAVDLTQNEKIKQLFHETREEGLVSALQKTMMDRLIRIHELPVTTAMIPLSGIGMVDVNTSRGRLMEQLRGCPYSRLAVCDGARANIIGVLDPDLALARAEGFDHLRPFVSPLHEIPARSTISEAIDFFRKHADPFVLVTTPDPIQRGKKKIIGMAAKRDLIEELAGELA